MKKADLETTETFTPQFDDKGLIPCVTTSSRTGKVLMMAYMNQDSIALSLKTGEAHYYSRSRQEIWHKGATSGDIQTITSMRTDCDQDCIWIEVTTAQQPETACHTGAESCFYREIDLKTKDHKLKKQ